MKSCSKTHNQSSKNPVFHLWPKIVFFNKDIKWGENELQNLLLPMFSRNIQDKIKLTTSTVTAITRFVPTDNYSRPFTLQLNVLVLLETNTWKLRDLNNHVFEQLWLELSDINDTQRSQRIVTICRTSTQSPQGPLPLFQSMWGGPAAPGSAGNCQKTRGICLFAAIIWSPDSLQDQQ